jgi:hypothetical protein
MHSTIKVLITQYYKYSNKSIFPHLRIFFMKVRVHRSRILRNYKNENMAYFVRFGVESGDAED